MILFLMTLGSWIAASLLYAYVHLDHPNVKLLKCRSCEIALMLPAIVMLVLVLGVLERTRQMQDWAHKAHK